MSGDTKGTSRLSSQTWSQIVEAPVGVMPVFASFDSKLGALSGLTKTRLATIDRMNEKAKAEGRTLLTARYETTRLEEANQEWATATGVVVALIDEKIAPTKDGKGEAKGRLVVFDKELKLRCVAPFTVLNSETTTMPSGSEPYEVIAARAWDNDLQQNVASVVSKRFFELN